MNIFKKYNSILKMYLSSDSIKNIEKNYNEKTRFYHNMSHLEQMIKDVQNNITFSDLSLVEKHTLLLGIFLHDVIYYPKKKDNEDQSIKFFKQAYIGKDPIMVKKVSDLIEVTKYRKRPIEKLQKIFWDADNAGFKKGYNVLLDNEAKIRKEFAFVSSQVYKENRIKFLDSCIGLFNEKADKDIQTLINHIKKIYK